VIGLGDSFQGRVGIQTPVDMAGEIDRRGDEIEVAETGRTGKSSTPFVPDSVLEMRHRVLAPRIDLDAILGDVES
jgi:hypothetical protein